jgi:hypothetical protein
MRRLLVGFGATIFVALIATIGVVAVRSGRAAKREKAAQEYVTQILTAAPDDVLSHAIADGMSINGDDEFRIQIARALAIIKHNSPSNYAIFTNNIQAIQMGPYTWTWPQMNPPTCIFEKTNIGYSATWTASLLVREGLHARLYSRFHEQYPTLTVPLSAWRSWKLQKQCMQIVLDRMPELGASRSEVEYMKEFFEKWYPEKQQDAPEPPVVKFGVSE